MKCRGFLFDLDGTLVDSLPVVERAWSNWGKRHGIAADEILSFIHGKQAITALRHFMPDSSEETIQQEFRLLEKTEAEDTDGITALPGALALLERLDALDIPWAIVTSGSMPIASARHKAGGLPLPQHFVTAEQVKNGKPEPDAYLIGAELLGLSPAECVVVEDAPAGILSGLAAGCAVIAVNAPDDTPRLSETAMRLTSLASLYISKEEDGTVRVLNQQ
ncbi:sugar phosphatase [Mixta intestinalis]|uniref:Sugar phosphatase YfbT n=1 Tax=Mixta intestinalis TaxID=1615494 RepID=A0A6P1PYW3_9GAMM|nr:sugar phosphatase [Mixta intestinalis]QHM71816.1 Sugar phosphatase YfbT [Mixta intestinalis]